MDVLLFALGCFGVIPVITLSIAYGGVMVLMPLLLAVGVIGQWPEAASQARAPAALPSVGDARRVA
jgi:hypothetical protein